MNIGILIKNNASVNLTKIKTVLAYQLETYFKYKEVDIVELNNLDLSFQHNILYTEKIIYYEDDSEFRKRFEWQVNGR